MNEESIPNLIDLIERAMFFDSEDREKQSELLIAAYEASSIDARQRINECLICICGWSMETLREQEKRSGG